MLANLTLTTQLRHSQAQDDDIDSANLIAQLLNADLQDSLSFKYAQNAQLALALEDSCLTPSLRRSHRPTPTIELEDDTIYSLRLNLDEMHSTIGYHRAQQLERESLRLVADATIALQFAQQLSSQRKKELVDLEFARALQQTDNRGRHDIDDPGARNADAVLGMNRIRELMKVSTFSSSRDRK